MSTIASCLEAAEYAARIRVSLQRLREDDPRSYPREAHHSHLVAVALAGHGYSPILEADYWRNYYTERPGSGRSKKPRADLWCAPAGAGGKQELFVEIKLAGLWGTGRRIGNRKPQQIVETWAEDVWRLLTGANRAHCGFVLCAFGDAMPLSSITPRLAKYPATRRTDIVADHVYEALCNTSSATAHDAIEEFLERCRGLIGASVSRLSSDSIDAIHVWPAIVEWQQDGPCASDWTA